jgi:hypothetical protein
MKEIDFYLISGLMVGTEFVHLDGEDGFSNGIVIDLFVVRIMFLW